ncbi:MAG: SRPBCC family protein [Nitrospirota bacterium]
MSLTLPPTFTLRFDRLDRSAHRLAVSQVLALPRERVFLFFEDPRNLFDITPDWLNFVMKDRDEMTAMCEGAEYDYTIRWLGLPLPWKSRITGYRPHEQFTDIQITGPYRSWSHLHTFIDAPEGTLMNDTVSYQLPLGPLGNLVHAVTVRHQLEDIFRYRAIRIDQWAQGAMRKKA